MARRPGSPRLSAGRAAALAATTASLLARSAFAQSPPSSPTATIAPVRIAVCAAEPLYQRAILLLSSGQYDEAEVLLDQVVQTCPNHPFAGEMLRLAVLEDDYADSHGGLVSSQPPRSAPVFPTAETLREPEQRDPVARAELVTVEAIFGGIHGSVMCATFIEAASGGFDGCSLGGGAGAFLTGALLGGSVSFFASWDGVRPGQTAAVEAGSFWGTWNGLAIGLMASQNAPSVAGETALGAGFHGGMVLGSLGGALIAAFAPPRAGQVALMNSGGLWAGAIGFMLSLGSTVHACCFTQTTFGLGQLVSVNVGLTAGAIASAFYPTSRWRMALVDLSSALGLGVGLGAGLLLSGPFPDELVIGVAGSIGVALGFGLGLGLTHAMDHPASDRDRQPSVRTAWAPVGPDGRPGLSMVGMF